MSLTSRSSSSAPFLTDSSVSAASYDEVSRRLKRRYVCDVYLAQGIKDVVEVYEDFSFGDLCDIVHAFTSIVSHTGILIGEAGENWRNDFS